MFTKLAIFAAGYVLGARAGRPRYDAIVSETRQIVEGEEVAWVTGFVRGAWWILSQRGRSMGRRVRFRAADTE